MTVEGRLPQRILFATAGLTIGGGIANLANSTLQALDQFVSDGLVQRVDILILHGGARPDRSPDLGDVALARSSNRRFAMLYARKAIAREFDLAIFDMAGVARSVRLVPPPLRPPFVVVAHGHEFAPPVRRALTWPISRALRIFAVSETTKGMLQRVEMPWHLPPIEIIVPCVSHERIEVWSQLEPAHRDTPAPTILTVGRLNTTDPGKGHNTLIQALPVVLESLPRARLVIVGEGDLRPELKRIAAAAGVVDSVTFTGFVSNEELGRLYQSATVFAMPSRQEGFGIVYAEAMWHGLPCIGSTADAAVDVIVDGETGLLVPYGDVPTTAEALVRFLDDPSYARALGEQGQSVCLDRYTPATFRRRLRATLTTSSQ